MATSTCLCHFPDGTAAIREVGGDPLTRGSQVQIAANGGLWYVTKHTATAGAREETLTKPFDVEIWVDREAPPRPIVQ